MKTYVDIVDGVVVGVHSGPDDLVLSAEAVEVTEQDFAVMRPGATVNNKGVFTQPLRASVRAIEPLDFARRFTDAELIAFEMICAGTDATAAAGRIATRKLALVKNLVHLDHADTIKYLALMKTMGVLTDQRIAEIRA